MGIFSFFNLCCGARDKQPQFLLAESKELPVEVTTLDPPPVPTVDGLTGNVVVDSMTLVELDANPHIAQHPNYRRHVQKRRAFLANKLAEEVTKRVLEKRRLKARAIAESRRARGVMSIVTESKELTGEFSEGTATISLQNENVIDHAGEDAKEVTAGTSLIDVPNGVQTEYPLDDFFKRPIIVYDTEWAVATDFDVHLKIWNLWANNAAVRAKLSNYAYFKGNLKVRVAFSGTPFHYGKVMLCYFPYPDRIDVLKGYDDLMGRTAPTTAAVLPCYKNYISQAPGFTVIDVKDNEPVEMTIPFISYKQQFRLWNTSNVVITNANDLKDFEEAGELRLVTLNQVGIANADYSADVSVNVMVWAENVQLGCITGTDIDITAESREIVTESKDRMVSKKKSTGSRLKASVGKMSKKVLSTIDEMDDEYNNDGPVSSIASAVGKAGEALGDIPIIGPFAKTTSTIANRVGKLASWFGFSKPLNLEKHVFVKNQPFSNGCNTAGDETAYKLSADPKQELTVDMSLGGMSGCDEMAIQNIASRESYLTTFVWSRTATPGVTTLWNGYVSPWAAGELTLPGPGTTALTQPTSMTFAAMPFKWWRGKIKIRFEVVCSRFHRGKLIIKYEPNVPQSVLISSASTQLNQQNTVIVDIQETQDVEITMDWSYPRAWASMPDPGTYMQIEDGFPVGSPAFPADFNGYLEVRVLNDLVQPTSTATVPVNVYVSCDDLQLAFPKSNNMPAERGYTYTASKEVTRDTINRMEEDTDHIHEEHFGEKILSFRSLLKRYCTSTMRNHTSSTTGAVFWELEEYLYPRPSCQIASAAVPDTTINQWSFWNYLRYAYLGMRGGMRHRVILNTDDTPASGYDYVRARLLPPDAITTNTPGLGELPSASLLVGNLTNNFRAMPEGTVNYHVLSNGGIEVEVPYYSNNLFQFASSYDEGYTAETDLDYGLSPFYAAFWNVNIGATSATGKIMYSMVDTAVAEDFQFLRYLGAPFYTI